MKAGSTKSHAPGERIVVAIIYSQKKPLKEKSKYTMKFQRSRKISFSNLSIFCN